MCIHHRGYREHSFVCPKHSRDRQKASISNKLPLPEAGRFMENRYLPTLHENISLSVLPAYRQVSNESRLTGRACLREAASA